MPSGGAASTRPSLSTPAPIFAHDFDRPEVNDFFLSAYWIPSGEQQPEGIWLDPVHRTARSITRDPFTREGALYEPVFRTIRTGDFTKGELILHSLAATSRFGLSQHQIPPKKMLIFGATLLDRSYSMGIVGEGIYGFVVVFGTPVDGIRESNIDCPFNRTLQNSGKLISPRHPLYFVLQDCLVKRAKEADADVFIGTSSIFEFAQSTAYHDAGSTVNPSFVQPPQHEALTPKVQLVTDVVRLHHYTRGFEKRQRRILRKDTVLMLHNYQEKAIGPVVTRPGPNHMPILVSELVRMTMMVSEVSQRETHSRRAMRANPIALRYLTQHMPADERDTFICLVSVFVYLHGVDAMHDPKERLQVTRPVAHLDTLIHLTMEPVSDEEIAAPNYLEQEFQWSCELLHRLAPTIQTEWAGLGYRPKDERILRAAPPGSFLLIDPPNRRQVFSLHVPNANQIDFRSKPTNSPSSPGTFYAEDVLALLPAGTVIVDRRPSTRKRADETTYEEWAALPKIAQINLSGLATKTVRTPGFKVKVTRYAPYNLDTILSHEPPADDTEYVFEPPVPSQSTFPTTAASFGHQEAAAAILDAFSIDGDGNETPNLGDATDLAGYHRGASNSFSRAYDDITARRNESRETRDAARVSQESGIVPTPQTTLNQQRTRSNSSPEPLTTSLGTQRPDPPAQRQHRSDYDPPTTPYLRPREHGELEEGEIDELEYMDDEELEYPPNSSQADHGNAMTLDSSDGDHSMPHWSPVDAEIPDATNETSVSMSTLTRPLPEPVLAQVMSPAASFSYPSIWETMPPEPLPSLHQSSAVIMVNTVIAEDASSIPRPPKPPLPPFKRRFSQLNGPEASSSSSSSENMVLGASVATTGSSSFGAGTRTVQGRFTPTTQFMGVLDFHQPEKQAGRHFSSSPSSVQNESSTPNSSPLLQIVSPGRESGMAELETYRRPARTLRIVVGDGDDAGDEMSSEEDEPRRWISELVKRECGRYHSGKEWTLYTV
ncbi:hypothetical protein C8J56DRAFT_896363 [Mycena floridula]|nr:hypothetical protein C8J56DRAFT_896363 [Mycena floridula]